MEKPMRHAKIWGLAFVVSLSTLGAGMACSSSDDESQGPPSGKEDGGAGEDSDANTDTADVDIRDGDSDAADGDVQDAGASDGDGSDVDAPDADASDPDEPDADASEGGSGGGGAGDGGDSGAEFDGTGLALGGYHSCAIHEGKAYCWGNNAYGQLGDGTGILSRTPALVADLVDVVELALGENHSCARLQGGKVACWGANSDGQLGDGTTDAKLTPTLVPGLTSAVEIASGYSHTCARLAAGSVECWGSNVYGELGDATTVKKLTPTTVSGLTNAVELALGMHHACARLQGGGIRCWGNNTFGQVGDGNEGTGADKHTPTLVEGSTDAVAIAVGHKHSCARSQGGSISCWGWNEVGQLGYGTAGYQTNKTTPTPVVGLTTAVELAAGGSHTCARLQGGSVECWGNNVDGQLGDGTRTHRSTPTRVVR